MCLGLAFWRCELLKLLKAWGRAIQYQRLIRQSDMLNSHERPEATNKSICQYAG